MEARKFQFSRVINTQDLDCENFSRELIMKSQPPAAMGSLEESGWTAICKPTRKFSKRIIQKEKISQSNFTRHGKYRKNDGKFT